MVEDEFQCIIVHAAVMTEKFSAHICMHSCPYCNNTVNNSASTFATKQVIRWYNQARNWVRGGGSAYEPLRAITRSEKCTENMHRNASKCIISKGKFISFWGEGQGSLPGLTHFPL